MSIEEEVLERCKPDGEEQARLDRAVNDLIDRVGGIISSRKLAAEPVLVGSVAKDTHLRSPDIDLFVRFEPNVPLERLHGEIQAIGNEVLKDPQKRYAQHPYMKGIFLGFDCEIVPCYKVQSASAKMSAVDRTPFHTNYIRANLDATLRDHVRLFKAFLKGIGIYGAEIAIRGFSGYLCEIMVLRFGGFGETLKEVAGWSRPVFLRLDEGDFPHFGDPLVFIDPVDPKRNVGAPVSHHSFSMLVKAARDYIDHPALEFFFPRPVKTRSKQGILEMFADRETEVVGIAISLPNLVEDIYASQVSKAERKVASFLKSQGFPVVKSGSFIARRPTKEKKGLALLVMETGVRLLSAVHIHKGPMVGHPNQDDFLEKWENAPHGAGRPHIENKQWIVYVKREFRTPFDLLEARLEGLGLGKHLSKEIKEGFDILDIKGLALGFRTQMSQFLEDRFPWER